ncbi:MAG: CHASE sensor domain-containing protein [Gammaproteobacteria bacterium]|nr:CHASE sensor domain-containing protein [Gammaproteobacteria bacterium]
MRKFADIPIAKKLVSIMIATTVTALLLASIMQGITESMAYRESIVQNLATIAAVIGTNSTAAITFEDQQLANQALKSLKAEPSILSGHIFDTTGKLMATYAANESDWEISEQMSKSRRSLLANWLAKNEPVHLFSGLETIDIFQPIQFDREIIGYIHLGASLDPLVKTLQRFAWMTVIAIIISILAAYVMSLRLQAFVSHPILALADLMRRVTQDDDFSLRAEKTGDDEVGSLIEPPVPVLSSGSLADHPFHPYNQ